MNINVLIPVFAQAYWSCPQQDCEGAYDAGIRAVVEALRDEMVIDIEADGHWDEDCAEFWFNDILGDAGSEKAAGGPTREDGQVAQPDQYAPAADPSLVCEWRANEYEGAYTPGCETPAVWYSDGSDTPQKEGYNFCPSCGKPIKLKEPKP